METLYIILKSLACLSLLMLFYKTVLEPLNNHRFKRFFLLAALLISVVIPFITFYNYVEPVIVEMPTSFTNTPVENVNSFSHLPIEEPVNYTPIILWSIYFCGVAVFSFKFILNLSRIRRSIKTNKRVKTNQFISVLLENATIPHTFFNYIFFNKKEYVSHKIPKEVLIHEQTHAEEKHSVDIVLIELFQVVFWFNPLLFFIKKDIRLNHEFLADKAVLNQGFETKKYQETLLQYSTCQAQNSLVTTINYPTLKKRFTHMKTQASKTSVLVKTLILVPVLALLVFSFSSTETVELASKKIEHISKSEVNPDNSFEDLKETYINVLNEYRDKTEYSKDFTTLQIKQNPLLLRLSGEQTSLKTLKTDLEKSPYKNAEVIYLSLYNDSIPLDLINKIKSAFGDNVKQFKLKNGYIVDNNNYSKKQETTKTVRETLPTINDHEIGCNNCKIGITKTDFKAIKINTTSNEDVISFKIEFPNKPVVSVIGNSLNDMSLNYFENYKSKKDIKIFDIKTNNENLESFILVKIKNDVQSNLTVNGIPCEKECFYNFTRKQVEGLVLGTTGKEAVTFFHVKYIKKSTIAINGNTMNSHALTNLKDVKIGEVIQLFNIKSGDTKFRPVLITLVADNSKEISNSPKVFKGEESSIPAPPKPPKMVRKGEKSNIPPPSPPEKPQKVSGFEKYLNHDDFKNAPIYYEGKVITKEKAIEIFKRDGTIEMITGKDSNGNYKIELAQDIDKAKMQHKIDTYVNHLNNDKYKNAEIFYESKKISKEQAIKLVKNDGLLNMKTEEQPNGSYIILLSHKKSNGPWETPK